MRRSPEDHPLVVLRNFLNLTQKEMGEACGIPTPTLRRTERRPSTLNSRLLYKICNSTWVDESWLREGDPSSPIRGMVGTPYLKQHFQLAQCLSGSGKVNVTTAMKYLGPILKDLLIDASNAEELKTMCDRLHSLMTEVRLNEAYLRRRSPRRRA